MRRILLAVSVAAGAAVLFATLSFVSRLPLRWMVFVAAVVDVAALLLWYLLKRMKPRDQIVHERLEKGLCPQCGYDLAGNLSGVCPECGLRW